MHVFIVDPKLARPPTDKTPAAKLREFRRATREPLDAVIVAPLDVRVLTAFLYQIRWVNVVEGCDSRELAALVAIVVLSPR